MLTKKKIYFFFTSSCPWVQINFFKASDRRITLWFFVLKGRALLVPFLKTSLVAEICMRSFTNCNCNFQNYYTKSP